MTGDIRIGDVVVSRGQKGAGFVEVLKKPMGPLSFPLQIVNGSRRRTYTVDTGRDSCL